MTKRDVECQVHTWMMKKVAKVIVYKMKEEKRKRDWKNYSKIIALGHVRGYSLLKTTPVAPPTLR